MFKIFFSDNRAVYETMLKTLTAGQAADNNKIRRMRFACWITTDYKRRLQTHTHS